MKTVAFRVSKPFVETVHFIFIDLLLQELKIEETRLEVVPPTLPNMTLVSPIDHYVTFISSIQNAPRLLIGK